MNRRMKIFLCVYVVLNLIAIFPSKGFCQQGWPLWDANHQNMMGAISDVFSSGRDMNGDGVMDEFHEGVDIAAPRGTPVFSVGNGVVHRVGADYVAVRVEGRQEILVYSHVQNILVNIGQNVTPNTQLAEIGDHPILYHLHFDSFLYSDPNNPDFEDRVNPLRPNGLLLDRDTPGIPSVDFVYLREDDGGAIGGIGFANPNLPIVWGKIDIVCRAFDPTGVINRWGQVQDAGVMQLMWKINENGVIKYIIRDGQWDGVVDNTKTSNLFNETDPANTNDDLQRYYYIITNTINPYNGGPFNLDFSGYWNSKLMRGGSWNGVDARINTEAEYKDGRNTIFIRAGSDIAEDLGGWFQQPILIDNFAPYLEAVVISNSSVYQAEWPGPVDNENLDDLNVISRDRFSQNELNNLDLKLLFSEDMNTQNNPSISAYFPNSGNNYNLQLTGYWADPQIFYGTLSFPELNDNDTGEVILSISGVKDLAGNLLDANPQTIVRRKGISLLKIKKFKNKEV